ncbi:MAG: hypothetical protein LBF68_06305 [Christensenellaceae bacterium]|jgi:hypothetical protein|nr:hypothetical protein [Christensenellaceae bacterium]
MSIPSKDNFSVFTNKFIDIYEIMQKNICLNSDPMTLFPTIEQIERYYAEMSLQRDVLEDELLSNIINEVNQRKVIKIYKNLYKEKGINLRTNRLAEITIQTEYRKVLIKRYLLSPISMTDKQLLAETEGKKNVYPVDICLGIDKLPFKTSVTGMLKIAKIAQSVKSYKSA